MSRFPDLLNPISDDSPCGPDLDIEGDDAFIDYTVLAEDRVPARYFTPVTNAKKGEAETIRFQPKEVDIEAEFAFILPLLERSRDLRLLSLAARFLILSGDLVGYADAVDAISALLETRWDEVHPNAGEDLQLRKNALEALTGKAAGVYPIQFASIAEDRAAGALSLRRYMLAAGLVEPIDGDASPLPVSEFVAALQKEEHLEAVNQHHDASVRLQTAFSAVSNLFADKTDYAETIDFSELSDTCKTWQTAIETARADLQSETETGSGDGAEEEVNEDVEVEALSAVSATVSVNAGAVQSHAEARLQLYRIEDYLMRLEPTSPCMVLVKQSRLLIGKSLMTALEMLMPNEADRATIILDKASSMQIDAGLMRGLTQDNDDEDIDTRDFEQVDNRSEALAIMQQVSLFFRNQEPSSPVPMLLKRAEGYFAMDFARIVNDLLPKQQAD